MKQMKLHRRFWSKVDKRGPDECWEWLAGKRKGYGQFRVGRRQLVAHRVAWELTHHDPIPDGMCVCHVCDNPGCCNPGHLFVGTQGDNIKDRDRKGHGPAGERNPSSKLIEMDVKFIRFWLKTGHKQPEIAEAFGVTSSAISHINTQRKWTHV